MGADSLQPSTFVIFGGTGDLSRRKLLPALARLQAHDRLPKRFRVLGVARNTDHDDSSFRQLAREALASRGIADQDIDRLCAKLHYQTIGSGGPAEFRALGARLEQLERDNDLPQNRALYLALPPRAFTATVERLGQAGLTTTTGWTRAVLEKPFGRDLVSARELNQVVHRHFREKQIYRIDHYLGKETVQNLLVFRFANALFESVWNRDRIQAIQITVAEDIGVGSRAGYYDRSGALRDMVQNHLTQLLTLVAMEVPAAFEADAIRYEKLKVLRSIAPVLPSNVVFGQYAAGEVDGRAVPAYRAEQGVAEGSTTETFVALKLEVMSWRWQGVPFLLRTGKRLPRRMTQIAIRFRNTPVCLFENMGGECMTTSDVLIITLQPDEGFSLHFDVKLPGSTELRRIPLRFRYSEMFDDIPEAYETLLADVLAGDQTLFVHADEVEASWELYDGLLAKPQPVHSYAAGTWGPQEAGFVSLADHELWQQER